jgi:hypothetical protein
MGERRDAYRALVWKPTGKRPLWRPRRGWEDNIKMDFQKMELDLAHDRDQVVGSIKCREFLDYLRNCQLLKENSGP